MPQFKTDELYTILIVLLYITVATWRSVKFN